MRVFTIDYLLEIERWFLIGDRDGGDQRLSRFDSRGWGSPFYTSFLIRHIMGTTKKTVTRLVNVPPRAKVTERGS
jgi:hypothetical protein